MNKQKGFRNSDITPERLHELLRYEPDTGLLIWKVRRNQIAIEGAVAGHIHSSRGKLYYRIRVDDNLIMGHHLVWMMVYGNWAKDQIDHINGDGLDNRLDNLRCVPQSENNKNAAIRRDNKTGVCGVTLSPAGTFVARIKVNKSYKLLGTFKTLELAAEARQKAMEALGFHENHGRPRLSDYKPDSNGPASRLRHVER